MTPKEQQERSAAIVGHRAIWLRRQGDYVVVLAERSDGAWTEVIREHHDGNYSHIVEPRGIEEKFTIDAARIKEQERK